ncbi:SymE family type I addiction module toxin [Dyadobacter chenwenxiniae]|uniref:SymE family type I addiction module toxin n=1 Tax=Dyadobacter chenwenxiniae TaxID=2906456 RepID=A0A9X1PT18_9BACT|nr:SymE family type I addiction module toxin [Dyadobacter chenwenxiniae]MCF0065133.1 SymE family type I addiction module toxin [Dyadobacter chenwenxiniae]UON84595.1 SymE family type I addiction module toxin [Dyadobacter chenwenxiniae]
MTHKKQPLQTNQRQLKIYQKYQRRENTPDVFLPEIRLCGKWLHDLGFACGEEVTVKYFENKLEITLNPAAEVKPALVGRRKR